MFDRHPQIVGLFFHEKNKPLIGENKNEFGTVKALSVGAIIRRKIFYDRSLLMKLTKKSAKREPISTFLWRFQAKYFPKKRSRERRKSSNNNKSGALTGTTTKYKDSDKNNPKCIHHF